MNEFWKIASALEFKDYSFMPAGIAFLVSIVVLIIMKRKGLLNRKHRWYDTYVFFYYLYIPVVFLCAGLVWAAIGSLERTYKQAYAGSEQAIIADSVEATLEVGQFLEKTYKDIPSIRQEVLAVDIKEIFPEKYQERLRQDELSAFMKTIAATFQKDIADTLAMQVNAIIAKHFSAQPTVSSEALLKIWNDDVLEAMRQGLAADVTEQRVNVFYQPNYRFVKIMFFIFLLPVILEESLWLFFTRHSRRKQRFKGDEEPTVE